MKSLMNANTVYRHDWGLDWGQIKKEEGGGRREESTSNKTAADCCYMTIVLLGFLFFFNLFLAPFTVYWLSPVDQFI